MLLSYIFKISESNSISCLTLLLQATETFNKNYRLEIMCPTNMFILNTLFLEELYVRHKI